MILILVGTFIAGLLGAVLSKMVKDGMSVWYYVLIVGWMPPLAWGLLAKKTPYNLMVTSALWTFVYEMAWFAVMIYSGESAGWHQAIGAALIIAGLVFMNGG